LNKVLEYSKKLAIVMKLYRLEMISDSELFMIRNKLKTEYQINDLAA